MKTFPPTLTNLLPLGHVVIEDECSGRDLQSATSLRRVWGRLSVVLPLPPAIRPIEWTKKKPKYTILHPNKQTPSHWVWGLFVMGESRRRHPSTSSLPRVWGWLSEVFPLPLTKTKNHKTTKILTKKLGLRRRGVVQLFSDYFLFISRLISFFNCLVQSLRKFYFCTFPHPSYWSHLPSTVSQRTHFHTLMPQSQSNHNETK